MTLLSGVKIMEIKFDKDVIEFLEFLSLDTEEIEELRKNLEDQRKQLVKRALEEILERGDKDE